MTRVSLLTLNCDQFRLIVCVVRGKRADHSDTATGKGKASFCCACVYACADHVSLRCNLICYTSKCSYPCANDYPCIVLVNQTIGALKFREKI